MASPSTRGLGCLGWALHLLVFLSLWVADPGAWLGGSAPTTTDTAAGSAVRRHAVMSPPPELKPPVQDPQEKAKRAEWLECLIQHELNAESDKKHAEVWVLRRPHIIFFRRLLMLRGFHAHSSTSQLKCRERTVDAEMTCVDCVRLLHGGFYGHMGVAVPAHPQQDKVMGCLQLYKVLNVTADPNDDQTNGAWDASPTTQYPFCNTLSVNYATL